MSASLLLPVMFTLAVLLAWARLLLRQRRTRVSLQRFALLMLMQPVCAALLYLTLSPPRVPVQVGTLSVLTAGADPAAATGAVLVTLPEAPHVADAVPVPDLATALRRYPGMALQVVGHGLELRDREVARGMLLDFQPEPLPPGLTHLSAPAQVVPGVAFPVGGRVEGVAGGQVRLLDPAAQVVDGAVLEADGRFHLVGHARVPGLVQYSLQLLDGAGKEVGQVEVPVQIAADPPVRVLLLAGAPNAEVRHLRRWATDAGLDVHMEVSVGAGVRLGDGPAPSTAEEFGDFDLVIVDTRSLAGMGPTRRAALGRALEAGLGVLVRVEEPLATQARSHLAALGLAVEGVAQVEPVTLPATEDAGLLRARMGPGSAEVPFDAALAAETPPVLERRVLQARAPGAVVPLQAGTGTEVGWWRARGSGRAGLWALTDSYRLALAGRADLHASLWSAAVSTMARAVSIDVPQPDRDARAGTRMSICGLPAEASVTAPDGQTTPLQVDPAAGARACAAYWPQSAGWHLLETDETSLYFHVRAEGEAPGIKAAALQEATHRLVGGPASADRAAPPAGDKVRRGPSWPWFMAWLGASGLLWWLERRRLPAAAGAGRRREQEAADA